MSGAILAGGFAAFLVAYIFLSILNKKQPRWYLAIGAWCVERLKTPVIVLTRVLEWIVDYLERRTN